MVGVKVANMNDINDSQGVIKMKTVIQVVQHLLPGGIETLSLDLAKFTPPNETIYIVSLEGDLSSALRAWPRLRAYKKQLIFMNKPPGLTFALVKSLTHLFKRLNAKAVHTHHIGPLLYAGSAARLAGIKHLIHTEHDVWHLSNNKRRFLQRNVIKLLKPVLVADANIVADKMRGFLQCNDQIKVIPNGIDTEHFVPGDKHIARSKLNLPHGVKLIGCSGRLEVVKGQDLLIKAVSQLPNVHLTIAGVGSLKAYLIGLVRSLNITDRVHFLGCVEDMPSFYQALDVFCLSSLNEGFPLSPLEAQSCNIISVVTDVGGAKETLCPNSGTLTAPNSVKAIADALRSTLVDNATILPRQHIQQFSDVRVMARAYANLR